MKSSILSVPDDNETGISFIFRSNIVNEIERDLLVADCQPLGSDDAIKSMVD